jgi:hypothetical protein
MAYLTQSAKPGGSNGQLQYNASGSFGGTGLIQYDQDGETLLVTGPDLVEGRSVLTAQFTDSTDLFIVEMCSIANDDFTGYAFQAVDGNGNSVTICNENNALQVGGPTVLNGTVNTSNNTLDDGSGNAVIAGTLTIDNAVTATKGLAVNTSQSNGGNLTYETTAGQQIFSVYSDGTYNLGDLIGAYNGSPSRTLQIGSDGSLQLGFFGTTGTLRPNVTGSKGGNVALASLCTALGNLGLINNLTT